MAQFYSQPAQPPYSTPNLQFYPSSYPVSGHTTPSQALYGNYGAPAHGNQAYAGAGFGAPGYEGEPALLEELGVNFAHIKVKTLTVLNPFARIDQHIMDDSDLAGPILFFLLFGTFLLFSGKVHFGYIYGLALVGSLSLHTIFSLMSPPIDPADVPHPIQDHMHQSGRSQSLSSTLTFPRSASVLGYCLLPLVLTSLVGVLLPMDTLVGYVISSAAIVWYDLCWEKSYIDSERKGRTFALCSWRSVNL
ncbi:MAG: Golgi membrane [Lasallia pustulata]|uniref:Golgi membrane n=1 Tax=Lasallia pustulata TaxID=136370 RepID=A0A5M8PS63_9LECA|nr:MAG: Golgi membrane [Lasallia pustulata]